MDGRLDPRLDRPKPRHIDLLNDRFHSSLRMVLCGKRRDGEEYSHRSRVVSAGRQAEAEPSSVIFAGSSRQADVGMSLVGLTVAGWAVLAERAAVLSRKRDGTRKKIGMTGRGSRRNSMMRSSLKKQLRIAVGDNLGWLDRILALYFNPVS